MALISKSQLYEHYTREFQKSRLSESFGGEQLYTEQLLSSARSFDSAQTYDIFLSHSYADKQEVAALYSFIRKIGYTVYVDWIQDPQLSRANITKSTANTLRTRMRNCKSLVYAHSLNAKQSRWVPWELGFMDAEKNRVAILPITEEKNRPDEYKGAEYLGLYPYVTSAKTSNTKKLELWVHDAINVYISMRQWLSGKNPYKR
ncbi:MAG: toll/interleukin-1 receptor domain-containing protein [Leptospiraceae bacterium]|nr:toll/interleukin-1 receptor domain-containing protein [Leptospiraceae bacterium]